MQLNSSQQKAVQHNDGPMLILAGAGSGKTRVLTHKVAYLIKEKKVDPAHILMVTFTNKAANEMKERIRLLLANHNQPFDSHTLAQGRQPTTLRLAYTRSGQAYNLPFAGTFHSLSAKILRRDGQSIGIPPHFVIYDELDQHEAVKGIFTKLDISTKSVSPNAIRSMISSAKNELLTAHSYLSLAHGYYQEIAAKVYLAYENLLKENHALDFDDLILNCVQLLQTNKDVRDRYQEQFHYVLVDEYQDTNHAQYVLTKLLSGRHKNICVVGDASQCFPPETSIKTSHGEEAIEKLQPGDSVIAAAGRGATGRFTIKKISQRKYSGNLLVIQTLSGKTLKVTPNHIVFAKLAPKDNLYHVYLMYRKDKGFRIGIAKGVRAGDSRRGKKPTVGIFTRGNQEAADKMWILKTCTEKSQASSWEYYFAFKYGVPTLVFDIGSRSMSLSQEQVNKFFLEIDTVKRAAKLMQDLGLDPRFPHHRPKGTSGNKKQDRQVIHLKFLEDPRRTQTSPWSMHRISLNTTDRKLKKIVQSAGFYTRPGRRNTWRTEIARLSYTEVESIAQKLSRDAGGIDISYEAFLLKTESKFYFHPASHLQPGMIIPIYKKGEIQEEEIGKIESQNYRGKVYDLEIEHVHNYIANELVIHNSIYGWRGANFRNIVNFKTDFPYTKVFHLEQNYRSTQTILDAAFEVISKNTTHPILKLWTEEKHGPAIRLFSGNNEHEEAAFIAFEIQKLGLPMSEIAVLYRTNAQSRLIEEALLHSGIPYTLVGGVRFYERKEIKDILAYLRLILNPKDNLSRVRVEKTGKTRAARFFAATHKFGVNDTTLDLLDRVCEVSRYLDLYDRENEEDMSRLENIKELRSVASEFPNLSLFLENVALVEAEGISRATVRQKAIETTDGNGGKVTLMTIHAAKGLEFSAVFLIGMEEGLFPHSRTLLDPLEVEEERRLCYVGMTRAKKFLYLTYATRRLYFGTRMSNEISRFVADIPENLLANASFSADGSFGVRGWD